jgi:hypothetical protein
MKNPIAPVNLTDSGGHDVSFLGRRIYPFHFLYRHYPYRSSQQMARKLFEDRKMDPEERQLKGWSEHYDPARHELQSGLMDICNLNQFRLFSPSFYDDYLIERLSAIGLPHP